MPFERHHMDRFQNIVAASYGSSVNPNTDMNGNLIATNPLDNKVLARLDADQEVNIENVVWTEGVEHDDSRDPQNWQGWAPHMNRTTSEHTPTPDGPPGSATATQPDDGFTEVVDPENPSTDPSTEDVKVDKSSKKK